MKWTVFATLLGLSLGAVVACSGTDTKRETCGNGIDDDGNGLVDCDDPDCKGQSGCPAFDAGYWGDSRNCAKCGKDCVTQNDCVSGQYISDRPLPVCTAGKCEALNHFVQVRAELDTKTSWAGATSPKSGTTRFIKKTALDGSAVTCATIAVAAADRIVPGAIEASGKFLVQGLDVTNITNPMLGQGVNYSFVNTGTGGNFLIWAEFWSGGVDSNTRLPQGRRQGYGCFEDAATVGGPIVPEDNCPGATNDAGVCRIFKLKMPPPEP
jgi:hypothetical protein